MLPYVARGGRWGRQDLHAASSISLRCSAPAGFDATYYDSRRRGVALTVSASSCSLKLVRGPSRSCIPRSTVERSRSRVGATLSGLWYDGPRGLQLSWLTSCPCSCPSPFSGGSSVLTLVWRDCSTCYRTVAILDTVSGVIGYESLVLYNMNIPLYIEIPTAR